MVAEKYYKLNDMGCQTPSSLSSYCETINISCNNHDDIYDYHVIFSVMNVKK